MVEMRIREADLQNMALVLIDREVSADESDIVGIARVVNVDVIAIYSELVLEFHLNPFVTDALECISFSKSLHPCSNFCTVRYC